MKRFTPLVLAFVFIAAPAWADQQPAKKKAKPAPIADSSARSALTTLGFDGRPSTLIGCAGGKFYNSHPLGFTTSGTRIRVDVISGDNIDPVATLVVLQMGADAPDGARAQYKYDDDSGGNLDPHLELTTQYDGNVVLNVGSYDGNFGCYWLKIEVTVP